KRNQHGGQSGRQHADDQEPVRIVASPGEPVDKETCGKGEREDDIDRESVLYARTWHMDRREDEGNSDDEEERTEPPNVIEVVSQVLFSCPIVQADRVRMNPY